MASRKTQNLKREPQQSFFYTLLSLVGSFLKRQFLRLFVLPFYVLVFLPWIILFLDDPRGKEQTVLFKLIAFLSWHPTATSLNEGNLIVATLTIFVAFDVVTEMYHRLRGQPSSFTTRDKTDFRRRFYIQCVLSLIGWTTVGLIKFRHDIETMVVFIGFGLISCAFFWFEYSIRSLLDSIDWHKVLSAVKTTE